MVITLKKNKEYVIEYRVFEDTTFYKAWFRNLKPKWGEWKKLENYDSLNDASKALSKLQLRRPYLKCRTEFRMVLKNGEK